MLSTISFRLLLIIPLALASNIGEILRTPQFMIISQHECETTFETNVQDKSCPQALIVSPREKSCDDPARLHLARDPSGQGAPWLIYVGADFSGRVIAHAKQLTPDMFPKSENASVSAFYTKDTHVIDAPNTFLDNILSYSQVIATLFDSDSRLLYVIKREQVTGTHCLVFYVRNLFKRDEKVQFELVKEFKVHGNNGARYDWSIDPYSKEVYYTTLHHATTIHAAPLSELMPILKEGISGRVILVMDDQQPRSHFRVAAGALFSYHRQLDTHQTFVRSLHREEKISCASSVQPVTYRMHKGPLSTLIVKDDDFCLVRCGRDTDLAACAKERTAWRVERGYEVAEPSSFWFIVLIISVVVLLAIALLLCICVCWMGHNMEEPDREDYANQHPPMPYYASNNPSNYIDCSVDGWNTMMNKHASPHCV